MDVAARQNRCAASGSYDACSTSRSSLIGDGSSTATGQIFTGSDISASTDITFSIEIRHRLRPERQDADVAVAGADDELVCDEVELDREGSIAVRQDWRRQSRATSTAARFPSCD